MSIKNPLNYEIDKKQVCFLSADFQRHRFRKMAFSIDFL
jgi:hypothetical protein